MAPENINLREILISVQLTYCLLCLDSAALHMLNEQHFYLFGQTQTSQKRGRLCSDTCPYGECSLMAPDFALVNLFCSKV